MYFPGNNTQNKKRILPTAQARTKAVNLSNSGILLSAQAVPESAARIAIHA